MSGPQLRVQHVLADDAHETLCRLQVYRVRRADPADGRSLYTCRICQGMADETKLQAIHEIDTPLDGVRWETLE